MSTESGSQQPDVRLLIDECIGKPLAKAIASVLRFAPEKPQVMHIIDLFGDSGWKDEDWVPQMAEDASWIVVTADSGRGGGHRLPTLCQEHEVSHVLISPSLHNAKQFFKARAIIAVWPRLVEAAAEKPGTRFKLRKGPSNNPVLEPSLRK